MHFLVIQHLDIEPPALIGEVFRAAGHNLTTIHLDQGEQLPASLADFNGCIIMGGPQSANDQSSYIRAELAWVKQALAEELPMLGICLGAQIMARAAGAQIIPSPVRELGWFPVYHTVESEGDALFAAMPEGLAVFQWHGETFSLTDAMKLVASHPQVPAQAFRLGRGQYGLQFHVEVDESIIEAWIAHGESECKTLGIEGISLLHRETSLYLESMQHYCRDMVSSWLKEIRV